LIGSGETSLDQVAAGFKKIKFQSVLCSVQKQGKKSETIKKTKICALRV